MCECRLIAAEIAATGIELSCECGKPRITADEQAALEAIREYLNR